VRGSVGDAHRAEGIPGGLAPVHGGNPPVEQSVGDVVQSREGGNQEELLEDEADVMGADGRQLVVGEMIDGGPADPNASARRALEGAGDGEKRRLP
jgi:hypothetical protein